MQLISLGGSEIFTYTLADFIKRKGHDVTVYSRYIGNFASHFQSIGVQVVQNLKGFRSDAFDLAHIHHNINALEVRNQFKNLPIIYVSHGILPFLEQAPVVDLKISKYLAVSEEVKNNLEKSGILTSKIGIYRNIIDSNKFNLIRPIEDIPKRILVLSYKITDDQIEVVRKSCECLNINCRFVGGRFGEVSQEVLPRYMNEVDIVISSGRGIMEAMMCGRVPIIFDRLGGDGIVTPGTIADLMQTNFSGRRYSANYTSNDLIKQIQGYRPEYGKELLSIAMDYFDAEKQVDSLLQQYEQVSNLKIPKLDESQAALLTHFIKSFDEIRNRTTRETIKKISVDIANIQKKQKTKISRLEYKPTDKFEILADQTPFNGFNANQNEKYTFHEKKKVGLISIVILTYNQLRYTKECIESINRFTPESHEIILVDNNSTDGTSQWLRQLVHQHANYKLIENKRNKGFSKGCNQGIQAASGEYILLLNNDVVVTEGWLSNMLACLKSQSDIGIVGPMTNSISGPQKVPTVGYTSIAGLSEYAHNFHLKNFSRRIPLRRIVGFCMLFSRQLVDDIGFLDESFGTGNFEDDDFCLRSEIAGYRNMIAGDVFIHHYGSRSFIGNKIDYGSALADNKNVFTRKWHHKNIDDALVNKMQSLFAKERAVELNQKGLSDQAFSIFVQAIKLNPGNKQLHYELAEMLIKAKQFTDALEILDEGIRTDDARKLVLCGYCKEGLDLYDEAFEYAERAVRLNAYQGMALNLKGIIAYKRGDLVGAEEALMASTKLDPGYAEPFTNLGILRWENENKQEAIDLLERGFVLSPTTTDLITAYHAAISETEQFERAEGVLIEARALFPNNKRIAYILIDVFLRQEKFVFAMPEIMQAIAAFGIEEDLLSAALHVRNKIGPQKLIETSKLKNTLSLCMVTQNAEPTLAKNLAAIASEIAEIIVVDTGSTDRTREIAESFGAQVFEKRGSNLIEASNYAILKAKGEWILVLKGNETILPVDVAKLKTLMMGKPAAYGFSLHRDNSDDSVNGTVDDSSTELVVRFFKRDDRIKFEEEGLDNPLKASGVAIRNCGISIHCHHVKTENQNISRDETEKNSMPSTEHAAILKIAELQYQRENFGKAAKMLQVLISEIPDCWQAYHLLADVMTQSGNNQELLEYLRPLEGRNDLPAQMHALVGSAYEAVGDLGKAGKFANNAMALDNGCAYAWNLQGILYYRNGDLESAKDNFRKAVELDPLWGEPWTNLGALFWDEGKQNEALDCYEKGFMLSPTAPNVATSYHAAVTACSKFERSLPIFEQTVNRFLDFRKGRFLFIDILLQVGNYSAAMAQIQSVLVRFDVEEGLLAAAKSIREKLGPMRITDLNDRKPTLSLCMIVKNEEQHIARCLYNSKQLVDEMIVVDTGSTDATKEIAQIFGAQLFDFEWIDDFSAARNFGLEKAAGDWILIMDADEVIAPNDHERLRQMIQAAKPPYPAFSIVTRNYTGFYNTIGWIPNKGDYSLEEAGTGWTPSEKVRLFRNDPAIRFVYPVHEVVSPMLKKGGISIRHCDVPVHHYGHLDRKKLKRKGETYFRIGMEKLDRSGDDAVAISELATEATIQGRNEQAIELWHRLLNLQGKNVRAHLNLSTVYGRQGKYSESAHHASLAAKLNPELKEAKFNLAMAKMYSGDIQSARMLCEKLLKKIPSYYPARFLAATCACYSGDLPKADAHLQHMQNGALGNVLVHPFQELTQGMIAAGQFEFSHRLLTWARSKKIWSDDLEVLQHNLKQQSAVI